MERIIYDAGDMVLIYRIQQSQHVSFSIYPRDCICENSTQEEENLVQMRLRGDDFPNGFLNGHTYRGSQSATDLYYAGQKKNETEQGYQIVTLLQSQKAEVRHVVCYYANRKTLQISTEVKNISQSTQNIEYITSFSLGGIYPTKTPESTKLCRIRSRWSAEGRVEKIPLEDLQLEPSWSGYGGSCERFGQTGSLPVRKFFPLAAVEDQEKGICWGARLPIASSWQMEACRRAEELCFSGGIADRDTGAWWKRLEPGESYNTPEATLTVCAGDFEKVCQRLLETEKTDYLTEKQGLPVIFNEFCTTWGQPSEANIHKTLETLKEKDIDYFIIDAGWYADLVRGWELNMGDWEVNPVLFPHGLKVCADEIRKYGMEPGIWFELEITGRDAAAFQKTDMLLQRDGTPVTTGNRRFWDMRKPETIEYLQHKVTDTLKANGFSYLKIDYNDSIGLGCDGAESLGEGLRQQILASEAFICQLKQQIPDLRIENCSSGGHRLVKEMMDLCDFASFSDAHEQLEIPVIAANLHRTIQPSKSEIWAVLRKEDDARRLYYSLCNTFLGVMCLSGDVYELSEKQWEIVERGIAFYRKISPVIIHGESVIRQNTGISYRHLTGTQWVLRTATDGAAAVLICHRFDGNTEAMEIDVPEGMKVCEQFGEDARWKQTETEDGKKKVEVELLKEFSAVALYLQK